MVCAVQAYAACRLLLQRDMLERMIIAITSASGAAVERYCVDVRLGLGFWLFVTLVCFVSFLARFVARERAF